MNDSSKKISVVIPAYNEERRLPSTLLEIAHYFNEQFIDYEVIVVDDGSVDCTTEVVEKFRRICPKFSVITHQENKGKGAAIRTGVLNTTGDLILFADADGATPFSEIKKLLYHIEHGADLAIGSRALYSTDTKIQTALHRKVIGRIFNAIVNLLVVPDIADTQCGFKLFKRKVAKFVFNYQKIDRFSFDVEILLIAQKAELNIKEVPINWTNIPGSKVNIFVDSIKMFVDVFRALHMHRAITPAHYANFAQHVIDRNEALKRQNV